MERDSKLTGFLLCTRLGLPMLPSASRSEPPPWLLDTPLGVDTSQN